VAVPDGVGIGCLKQAVHLAFGVVEQLQLPHTELVGFGILRFPA
jgi:hypothetical protein